MAGALRSILSLTAWASLVMFAGLSDALAERSAAEGKPGIDNFLTENTLTYPGQEGEQNLIHFGRFGNFDWYFPCEFESGDWSLGDDQTLRLTYHNPRYKPRQLKLEKREDGIALVEPGQQNITVAKLLEGNKIPWF
ncbi:MAG: hypothetical protein OER92_07850 [Alphaproteobacteria bacterium]|nr:hypothetical protein [Alphaproteobacteria bacterium]